MSRRRLPKKPPKRAGSVIQLTVLDMELDGGAIGDLCHPHVEILGLPRLEKEDVVAVVKFGKLVELVQLRLGIKLGVFPAVRKHGGKIIEEMSVPKCVKRHRIRISYSSATCVHNQELSRGLTYTLRLSRRGSAPFACSSALHSSRRPCRRSPWISICKRPPFCFLLRAVGRDLGAEIDRSNRR